MIVYSAEHAYKDANGNFTSDVDALNKYAEPPILSTGECSAPPRISLSADGQSFVAQIEDSERAFRAEIHDDRLLLVYSNSPP